MKTKRRGFLKMMQSLWLALWMLAVGCGAALAAQATPLALWTGEQLAEPRDPARLKAERAIRQLPAADASPPVGSEAVVAQPAPLAPERRRIIRRVALPEGDRRVALTFDLCERAVHVTGYDAALVDALRGFDHGHGAKATFFAGGKWLRSHPERALQLMADPRFELGHHGWTHANMLVATPEERLRQVRWTSAQFAALNAELSRRLAARGLPQVPPAASAPAPLFRLPYGRGNAETAAWLGGQGLAVIQWDVVGEGFGGTAQERARAIAGAVRPGSIVLLHANCVPRDTAQVLRLLLPLLAQRGYRTATVGELLASGTPEAVDEGFFSQPGDNAVYDALFGGHGTLGRAGDKAVNAKANRR